MKIRTFFSISILALLSIGLVCGCKKKKDDPKNFTNADFAGTWNVTDGCCSGTYQITVAASGSDGVTIQNLRKCTSVAGWNITGTVSGNALTIAAQNVTSTAQGGPYKFTGSGTLNTTSSLSITYTIADVQGTNPTTCTATCTK